MTPPPTTDVSAPRGGWLSAEEDAAWRGLLRMHAALSVVLNRELTATSGLSLQDYGVLVQLADRPDGRMRPFELSKALGVEKSRLSHHLDRLVARGSVARRPCPTDQRGWFVEITAAGRARLRDAAPGHVAAVREAFVDRLTPAQLETLAEIAARVAPVDPAEPSEGERS